MAASDELARLTARAKEAEDHAAAAKAEAKSQLEQALNTSRENAETQADKLRTDAEARAGEASDRWKEIQLSWNEHLQKMRQDMDQRKATLDSAVAQDKADQAEFDAVNAIDFAYAAIAGAEYAVLDATLAREEADELAAKAGG